MSIIDNLSSFVDQMKTGLHCEITCTKVARGHVWNIGLRKGLYAKHNKFAGWGRSLAGALTSLASSIKRQP